MKGNRNKEYIYFINKHYNEIRNQIANIQTFEEFNENLIIKKACSLDVGMIGEYVSKLDINVPNLNGIIRLAKNMRNIIFHSYGSVDFKYVWDAIVYDLPMLIDELNDLIK